MTTDHTYDWRHGYVPLTMRAALQKAHGNHEQAAKLLGEAREARARRRGRRREVVFVTPHPKHQAAAAAAPWRALTDDDLADALGTADDATADRILHELERRERAAAKAEKARARRHARRTAAEEQRGRDFDAACDAGEDPDAAYARVYGITEEKQRRAEVEESLRGSGYTGRTFRDRVKHAHADQVSQMYRHAEDVCRGHMLSPAGQRAGVDPESLFSGPAAAAKKYASEELRDYWRAHGRLTLEDFTAGLLGGHAKFRTTGDDW